MKIKDISGKELEFHHKDRTGSITVNDKNSYNKYLYEKNKTQEIIDLKKKLADMELMIKQLSEKLNDRC